MMKTKKCPCCQSTRINTYNGKSVCQCCGYKNIDTEILNELLEKESDEERTFKQFDKCIAL